MNIYDIARNKSRMLIFNRVIEEACRQWCDLIEDAPERKSGNGFSDFFYEIFEEKEKEYLEEIQLNSFYPCKQGRNKEYER